MFAELLRGLVLYSSGPGCREILRPDLLRCLGSGAQGGVVTEPIVSAPDLLRSPRSAILIPLRLTLTSTNTLSCVSLLLDSLDDVEWKKNRAGHVYVSTAKAYTFGRDIGDDRRGGF